MNDTEVNNQIRKAALRRLLISIPLLAAGLTLLIWMFASGVAPDSLFRTPTDSGASVATLSAAIHQDKLFGEYLLSMHPITISADAEEIVDTGVVLTVDDRDIGRYIDVPIEEKYISCFVPTARADELENKQGKLTFTGVFCGPDPEARKMIQKDMQEEGFSASEITQMAFPYEMDTREQGLLMKCILYAVTSGLLLGSFLCLYKGLRWLLAPETHPFHKWLKDKLEPDARDAQ